MVGIAIDSRRAACACCTSPVQFDLTPILPYVAVDKDAFPSNPAQPRRLHQIIQLAKTSPDVSRENSSAIAAFVRFAVTVAQLSKAFALNRTCVFGTFQSGGLSL